MGKHCEAVELLLARMDSNPEEFTEYGRWEKHIVKYRPYLPMEDQMALTDKINALRLDVFHKDVMKELLAEPNDDVARAAYTATTTIPVGGISPVGGMPVSGIANNYYAQMQNAYPIASAVTPNAVNLSQNSIKDIAAAMSQYAANTWKKP
jgi:hypothetical protein